MGLDLGQCEARGRDSGCHRRPAPVRLVAATEGHDHLRRACPERLRDGAGASVADHCRHPGEQLLVRLRSTAQRPARQVDSVPYVAGEDAAAPRFRHGGGNGRQLGGPHPQHAAEADEDRRLAVGQIPLSGLGDVLAVRLADGPTAHDAVLHIGGNRGELLVCGENGAAAAVPDGVRGIAVRLESEAGPVWIDRLADRASQEAP